MITFLNKPDLIFFCTQWNGFNYWDRGLIILFNILCTQCSGYKYCYFTLIIQFNITHRLNTVKWFLVLCLSNNSIKYTVKWSNSSISNNSIKYKLLVWRQFKYQTTLIWSTDITLSDATLQTWVNLGVMAMKGWVFCIPKSSLPGRPEL